MTVYADILVIVNLYIDFFLLRCVRRFLHLHVTIWRLLLGALTGALCALTALLPLPGWLSLPTGIASALLTAAAAFLPLRPPLFCRAALSFWIFSFLLAGCCLFILRCFAPGHMAVLGNAVYVDLSLPMLFFCTCAAYGAFWLFQRLFRQSAAPLRTCRLVVEHNGRCVELFARADSGNALREPFSGLPVVVCEADALRELLPPGVREFLDGDTPGGQLRLVPFESIGGTGVLPAFRPEKVTAGKEGPPLECYLAVCGQRLSAGDFAALYNPDLFPEERGP